jgi:prepilin-type N-terminal cleavage/methylation domain-containing protein
MGYAVGSAGAEGVSMTGRMNLGRRGFTLIEMAMVLAIVGFFITAALNVVRSVQLGTGVQLTNDRLDRIQKALQVYVIAHACLPCPANGATASTVNTAGHAQDGTGTTGYVSSTNFCTANACSITTVGVVPWIDLGLSEQDITDGWNGRIRYAIGGTPCGGAAHIQTSGGMNACGVGGTGTMPSNGLWVADFDVTSPLDNTSSNNSAVTAVYVLISSGPDKSFQYATLTGTGSTTNVYSQSTSTDGQGLNSAGTTSDHLDGTHTYPIFARGSLDTQTSTSHFDDIVRFVSASAMIYNCGPGACGNPN